MKDLAESLVVFERILAALEGEGHAFGTYEELESFLDDESSGGDLHGAREPR